MYGNCLSVILAVSSMMVGTLAIVTGRKTMQKLFFLANKLSFDLVKIAIQRYFISNLPICNGKKLTRTKLIFSPAPEWRMFHFYLFLHLSLNLCADIYESGLHWYLPWKVDREGLGTSMKKPKHTNWVAHRLHKWTCCKRGKGWNTCFLICPF